MKVAARFAHMNGYHPANTPEAMAARLGIHPAEVLKLDANENPFGPSPQARRALAQLELPHRYPDASYAALRTALADFCGAPAELIQVGAGADELIDFTLRCLLEPGEIVLNLPPTFSMYPIFTGLNGGKVVSIPRLPGFRLDLPAIRQAVVRYAPKALFLAAPNNPDGSLPDAAEIYALLELPILTILDEAYVEFSDGDLGRSVTRISEVAQRNNLVVLRTFSKWAGLAGLRFGYGSFPEWLATVMENVHPPYNVSRAAEVAALASLADLDWLHGNVLTIRSERQRMLDELGRLPGLEPFPSLGNFILCRCKAPGGAESLLAGLAAEGILVRGLGAELSDCLRLTVGRPEDNHRLMAALGKILVGERSA